MRTALLIVCVFGYVFALFHSLLGLFSQDMTIQWESELVWQFLFFFLYIVTILTLPQEVFLELALMREHCSTMAPC